MKKRVFLGLILIFIIAACTVDNVEQPLDAKMETPTTSIIEEPTTIMKQDVPTGQLNNLTVVDDEIPAVIPDANVNETPDAVTSATPAEPDLIAHWRFEGEATDYVNNYDGAVFGDPGFDSGKIGKAIYFDGVDDYIAFSQETIDAVGSLSKGTIAFYFKFESMLDKQTVMPIFYLGTTKKNQDNGIVIEIGHFNLQSYEAEPDPNNKKIYTTWMNYGRDPYLCFDSNRDLEENKWYHYALVVGPEGNTGYLDGVEMTGRNYNFGSANNPSFLSDISAKEMLALGYGRSSYLISPELIYFKGAVDDFRIYSEPLSAEEIAQLSNP